VRPRESLAGLRDRAGTAVARARALVGRLPIRAKLTVAYAGVIALMLGAIGLFLYVQFTSGLDGSLNRTLDARADDVGALLAREGATSLERNRTLLSGGDLTAQVVTPTGKVLFGTAAAMDEPPLLGPDELRDATAGGRYVDLHERERVLMRRTGQGDTVLLVGASLAQRERALELLNGALLVGGGLTLLVAALSGYGLAGAVLRPMDAMRRAAANISDIDPQARLPLPLAEDEVHRLGVTLNDMLARLERARDRERTFVSDASHELRTPLSILKTEVEVALRKDNPPEVLRAALGVAAEEADRLTLLAEDLLLIARSDAGRLELDRRRVDARRLLDDVDRRFRVRAREAGRALAVQADEGTALTVDVARVEQALTNLVDNALRHGAGTVTLRAQTADGHVELHVLDHGPGLPAAFIPHAFERFSRAQTGRTGQGSGLGLAIVELIAAAHSGEAHVRNRGERRGVDAWLRLPVA
jgi:two-component system OmpR family sensor kinase